MKSAILLLFSLLCVVFAFLVFLRSADGITRDVTAGIFLLLALGLAVPAQLKDAVAIVGPYVPWKKDAAAQAAAATQQVAADAAKVADKAQEAASLAKSAAEQSVTVTFKPGAPKDPNAAK
jgi:hypothetical protein